MGSQQTHDDGGSIQPSDLTAFQRDLLGVLARGADYGLGIKRTVEARYGEDINHGRLYPNLDDLEQMGLIEKSTLDKRTNEYALTEQGAAVFADQRDWLAGAGEYSDGFVLDAEHASAPTDENGDPVFSDE